MNRVLKNPVIRIEAQSAEAELKAVPHHGRRNSLFRH
jgi:hypothetical protein